MKKSLAIVFSMAMLIVTSCAKDSQKPSGVMGKITELPELTKAEEKIDSLNKLGIAAELQILVLPESLEEADSSKNIGMAFIQGNYGVDELIFYQIRFNKEKEEIISVEKY